MNLELLKNYRFRLYVYIEQKMEKEFRQWLKATLLLPVENIKQYLYSGDYAADTENRDFLKLYA